MAKNHNFSILQLGDTTFVIFASVHNGDGFETNESRCDWSVDFQAFSQGVSQKGYIKRLGITVIYQSFITVLIYQAEK